MSFPHQISHIAVFPLFTSAQGITRCGEAVSIRGGLQDCPKRGFQTVRERGEEALTVEGGRVGVGSRCIDHDNGRWHKGGSRAPSGGE